MHIHSPQYSKGGEYTVKAGGTGVTADVETLDLNTAPTFSVTTDTQEIPENSPIGTVVGTYTATDVDGDTITYSLAGDDDDSFTINSDTGAVTTNTLFDYESGKIEYKFTVSASDGEATSEVAVTVTVNVTDVGTTITSYALSSTTGEIMVDGTLPTMPTLTYNGGADTIAITDWTWNTEPALAEGVYAPGIYTATPVFNLPAEFVVAQGVTVPTYTLTITEYSSTTEITGYQPVDAITGFTGTAEADLGLPEKVTALYDGGSVECDVTWTCDEVYSDISLEEQTFTGTVTLPEGYEEATGIVAPVAKVTLRKRAILVDGPVVTFKVSTNETYAEDYYSKLVDEYSEIEVSVEDAAEKQTISVMWPDSADDFADVGGSIDVSATFIDDNYITIGSASIYARFETVDKKLSIRVNEYDYSGAVVLFGQDATVTASYYDDTAEYAFAVTDIEETANEEGLEFSNDLTLNIGSEYDSNTVKRVTVFVKVGDQVVAKGSTIIYFRNSLYYGSVYIDATEENPTYSAIRVNKAAGMTVTADFRRFDGADVVGNYFALIKDKDETTVIVDERNFADGKAIFTPADLAELRGTYRIFVQLKDNEGNLLHEFARTTYIDSHGVWYTYMKTNGINGNIYVNKNKPLYHEIQFDDKPGERELNVGCEVLVYGDTPEDETLTPETTTDGYYKFELNVAGKTNGAYTIFTLAKKTDDQNFYDFNFGRTIYINDSAATICNIKLNGSTYCSLDGGSELTVSPYWAQGSLKNQDVTYKYMFYKFDGTKDGGLGDIIEIGGKTEFTAENEDPILITNDAQSVFGFVNVVVIEAYVNGDTEADMTLSKIFYK